MLQNLKNYFVSWICIGLILVFGIIATPNYGITTDETLEVNMIEWNINYIKTGKEIPLNLRYYGTFFNGLAELVFHLTQPIEHLFSRSDGSDDKREKYLAYDQSSSDTFYLLKDKIQVKHYLTFLFSIIAYWTVVQIISILISSKVAWLGVVNLALIPQFWGHSFFNPKDIPFATWMTVATLCNVYAITFLSNFSYSKRSDLIKLILFACGLGIIWGTLAGIRMPGILSAMFFIIVYLTVHYKKGFSSSIILSPFTLFIVTSSFIAYLTIIILYPSSWQSPLKFIIETLNYLSNHDWNGLVHFQGRFILAHDLPWTYIPTWILISVPEIILISSCIGLIYLKIKYSEFNVSQKACALLVGFQLFFFPIVAIINHSTVYDAIRQFLFIMPCFAILASLGIFYVFQLLKKLKKAKWFYVFIVCILYTLIISDMISLHPYEYIYFNRASGGLANGKDQYQTDYYNLSVKEAIDWINKTIEPGSVIALTPTSVSFYTVVIQSSPKNIVISEKILSNAPLEVWDSLQKYNRIYYLEVSGRTPSKEFAQCPVIYSVQRQGITLSMIRECSVSLR